MSETPAGEHSGEKDGLLSPKERARLRRHVYDHGGVESLEVIALLDALEVAERGRDAMLAGLVALIAAYEKRAGNESARFTRASDVVNDLYALLATRVIASAETAEGSSDE